MNLPVNEIKTQQIQYVKRAGEMVRGCEKEELNLMYFYDQQKIRNFFE